ncbi:MAG: FAD-dependent thymidylate synthase [Armatimonadetes bacterium]|nr:FAD-dependent thymidylate synthase [Armatimonadota bacterium]
MDSVGASFLSAAPEVTLVNCFRRPYDHAVAAARTCYSGAGIVTAEQVAGDNAPDEEARARARQRRDALAASIFQAGHHTVFQHAHFQFALANVSRHFTWSFLHSHPFYNSEQVSQRYVAVQEGNYAVPPLAGEALATYRETVQAQLDAYHQLCQALAKPAAAAYFQRFPGRARQPEQWQSEVNKKAMEVARYVLPVATFTYLYHTVSSLTLFRYHQMCRLYDAPLEQQIVVGKMVECLLAAEPEYARLYDEPIPLEETPEHAFVASRTAAETRPAAFRAEFDASLEGHVSRLVDWKTNHETILAQSVREVLGLPRAALDDDEAIRLVLDPGRNPLLGQTLNLTAHGKLTRCLAHAAYTFRKKLSHTADSQDQRHRTTPGSRPLLAAHLDGEPDYITPELVRHDEACERLYAQTMARSWEGMSRLSALGVPAEYALYLLPNAAAIRFTESADLLSLRHKLAMRLCFNAQEEIWRASLDEARQIRALNPRIGRYLLPPCGLRHLAGERPICPEGKRFCGIPVWKQDLDAYRRVI